MTSTFWGLRLEPGKRYSTTVDKSFHVSMAALDCTTVKTDKEVHSVMLEEGESNIPFILCNLHKPKVIQSPLNLNFVSGDRVTFFCRGNGTVHLTGYLMAEEDDDFAAFGEDEVEDEEVEEEEVEDEEDEEEVAEEEVTKGKQNGLPGGKRKGDQPAKPNQKKLKIQQSDDDEDEDEDMEEESLEEEEDESEEESEENEVEKEAEKPKPQPQPQPQQQQKKNKKQKKQQQTQSPGQQQTQSPGQQQTQSPGQQQQQGKQKQKQQNGLTQQSPGQQKKKGNEEKTNEAPLKKTLEGGVFVKDLKLGNGPICKPGRMASVYYVGKLKSNNKIFDQTTQGAGFKFRVGRGEVIKGWDIGLAGMKVGGKRLITCPPNMAYGQKGSPPTIPGNSTLMFEVELKSVD